MVPPRYSEKVEAWRKVTLPSHPTRDKWPQSPTLDCLSTLGVYLLPGGATRVYPFPAGMWPSAQFSELPGVRAEESTLDCWAHPHLFCKATCVPICAHFNADGGFYRSTWGISTQWVYPVVPVDSSL